mmetsp:Transcript_21248/g.46115  ORF Transcript_21248/g.46115 Transcript_21248/m.46115 type:complete len:298 (+) Transcript_21248:1-894(+)
MISMSMKSDSPHHHHPDTSITASRPSSSSSLSNHDHYSHSAILFSSTLIQHLESHPSLRLPSTYIGVRRVRPKQGGDGSSAREDGAVLCTKKRKRRSDDDDDDDVWVPNDVIGDSNNKDSQHGGNKTLTEPHHGKSTTNNTTATSSNNKNYNPQEIVYKITNPDGTQRRMTKAEKKLLKYQLSQAKLMEKKEERQKQHDQRIKVAKEGKRERKRLKKLAWKNKLLLKQREQNNEEGGVQVQENGQSDDKGDISTDAARQRNSVPKEEVMACKSDTGKTASRSSSAVQDEDIIIIMKN